MESSFSLHAKNILVTGASSGIGRQCAVTCSQLGATVILLGRNEGRLQETFQMLASGDHLKFSQDVTHYDQLEPIIEQSVSRLGQLSGFIHAAGIQKTLPLRSMKPQDYEELFAVNVIAGFELAKILAKKKYCYQEGASFVFIASIMGVVGNAALTGYSATKGALIAGIKSMAVELAPKHIRVNCLSPGYIQTEMMEHVAETLSAEHIESMKSKYLLGLGTVNDVANAATFLLSDASRWMTGINLIVDGGYSAL